MNSLQAAEKIRPSIIRYLFAFFAWCCLILAPFILVILLIPNKRTDFSGFWFFLAFFLFEAVVLYPYHTLSIDGEKISGATLWGWLWRREEIRLSEISRERIMKQNLGRLAGITILYSKQGEKILTLGLSDSQISRIMELSKDKNGSTELHQFRQN
jgi:hypothetical protein